MTKPTKWLCAQRRLRSAWASALSDQSLRLRSVGSYGRKLSSCGQRRLWSDWADAQADMSLRWAHTHFVFVMSQLTLIYMDPWWNLVCWLSYKFGFLVNSHRRTYTNVRIRSSIWFRETFVLRNNDIFYSEVKLDQDRHVFLNKWNNEIEFLIFGNCEARR